MPGGQRGNVWRTTTAVLLAAVLVVAAPAVAGTPGPQQSLGRSGGLEYVAADLENVVSAAGPRVTCPPGTFATGGGLSMNGHSAQGRLLSSYPTSLSGDGWQSEGVARRGHPETVRTWAVCGPRTLEYTTDTALVPSGSTVEVDSECERGSRLTGGGVRVQGGSPFVSENTRSIARTWRATVTATGDDSVVSTYAGCRHTYDLQSTEAGDDTGVPEHGGASAIARCPRGHAVTSGGVRMPGGGYSPVWINSSHPWDSPGDRDTTPDDGWRGRVHNGGRSGFYRIGVYATCKKPRPNAP